jgi:hypothetical protein
VTFGPWLGKKEDIYDVFINKKNVFLIWIREGYLYDVLL